MTEITTPPNTSGMGKAAIIPDEIKGWSWGGFISVGSSRSAIKA